MATERLGLTERLLHRSSLARWRRAVSAAGSLKPARLRELRAMGKQIAAEIGTVIAVADKRLARPVAPPPAPIGSDWSWQPHLWRADITPAGHVGVDTGTELSPGLKVFHDCAVSELCLRQLRPITALGTHYALQIDSFGFDGSFLSLAIELPDDAAHTLRLRHLLRIYADIETDAPLETFARLNVRHGPNTDQILRELDFSKGNQVAVEFDLSQTKLNEKRIERAWVDLIFERPLNNRIRLRDVALSRRNRAEV